MLEMANLFIRAQGNSISENTKKNYRSILKNYSEYLAKQGKKDYDISLNQALDYNDYLAERYKTNTHRQRLATLNKFYNFLLEIDEVKKNYYKTIKYPKAKSRVPKTLDIEGVKAVMRESKRLSKDKVINLRNELMITLLLSNGLRVGELANITIEDVRGNKVLIRNTKNKIDRLTIISKDISKNIERYIGMTKNAENKTLFGIGVRQTQRVVNEVLENAGYPNVKVHDLRHTSATLMLKSGVDIRDIQVVLGHKDISTTQIYTHVLEENKQRVADIMSQII